MHFRASHELTKPESVYKLLAHLACIGVAVRDRVARPGSKMRKKLGRGHSQGATTPKIWVTPENSIFRSYVQKYAFLEKSIFFIIMTPFGQNISDWMVPIRQMSKFEPRISGPEKARGLKFTPLLQPVPDYKRSKYGPDSCEFAFATYRQTYVRVTLTATEVPILCGEPCLGPRRRGYN